MLFGVVAMRPPDPGALLPWGGRMLQFVFRHSRRHPTFGSQDSGWLRTRLGMHLGSPALRSAPCSKAERATPEFGVADVDGDIVDAYIRFGTFRCDSFEGWAGQVGNAIRVWEPNGPMPSKMLMGVK